MENFLRTCFGGYVLREWAGGNFYPFPPILARPLARAFPSLAVGLFLRFEKTREYDGEFLRFPREQVLETNFFLGPIAGDSP